MSVPTPTTVVKATAGKRPTGAQAWMERLREADAAGIDALMVFAADLKAHQLAQAYKDVDNYTLWRDGRTVLGLRKLTGEFRRVQRCYNWPCWACSNNPFWSTISATNAALMRHAQRIPELATEIEGSLVNPKHYYICLWLTREHNEAAVAKLGQRLERHNSQSANLLRAIQGGL
jgi:hypothetical protein